MLVGQNKSNILKRKLTITRYLGFVQNHHVTALPFGTGGQVRARRSSCYFQSKATSYQPDEMGGSVVISSAVYGVLHRRRFWSPGQVAKED